MNTAGLIVLMAFAAAPPYQAPAGQASREDPLGRSTPRGTLVSFLREAGEGNLSTAVAYLEIRGRPGFPNNEAGRALAEKLELVLNSYLQVDLRRISDSPEGQLDDGLPPDQERLGTISVNDKNIDILMHRISDNGVDVWVFSSGTLTSISPLPIATSNAVVEQYVPEILKRPLLLDVAGWRWLALLALIPISFLLARLISLVLVGIARRAVHRIPTHVDDRLIERVPGPLQLFLTVSFFYLGSMALALSLLLRAGLKTLELIGTLVAVSWFLLRGIDVAFEFANIALVNSQRTAAMAVIPMARRITKALAGALTLLFLLDNLGFDSKAVIAGLGIGGIALALAAQKTLENVFGGMALVLDQPIRIGHFCKFGDVLGTVEDIGLRSTRIRTLDQTVVSVPNAQLASTNIENFAARGKVWFHPILSIRFDTSTDQLRYLLERLRQLLETDARIEKGARVRLVNARPAFDLEVFCYVGTADYEEFLAIQEELLFRFLEIIREAGTSLATPVQVSYSATDRGVGKALSAASREPSRE